MEYNNLGFSGYDTLPQTLVGRAYDLWENILNGDYPIYDKTDFSDVEDLIKKAEPDEELTDYEIETYMNRCFVDVGYEWVNERDDNNAQLVKQNNNKVDNKIKQKANECIAYDIYEKKGQYAVYDAVNNGTIKHDYWKDCKPCKDTTPFYDNYCLICSTIDKES